MAAPLEVSVPLHIAVDATSWPLARGYGRHARGLLTALLEIDDRHRYTFVTDEPASAASIPARAAVTVVPASTPTVRAAGASGRRRLSDMARMGLALSRVRADVVLFPTIYSYVPVVTRAKKLVTIHDVTAETYPALVLGRRAARASWAAKTLAGRWQADAIIAVSDYARRGIVERFGVPPERVHVVGEAADPIFRPMPDARLPASLIALGARDDARLVVYLGGFSPHKNLPQLVSVFHALHAQPRFADIQLVLVGDGGDATFTSCYASVRRQVRDLGLDDRVLFTGFLPDDEVVPLLNVAAVLALPSLAEGFGLPAIEAAACGCPVVATRESPLPRLLGEGGLFVDPHAPGELETALARVLDDEPLRQAMGAAGRRAAQALSWRACARDLLAVIESVAAP